MVVKVEDVGRVRVCTIDRPEKRNAIDRHVYRGLLAAFEGAAGDDGVGALVLTGAGDKAFSAGVDLAELEGGGEDFAEPANRFVALLADYPKPLVFAINGMAVGMGTTLLGYADLAFAAESARFRTPFTEMGVGAELGSSWLLPHLLGWQRAAWLLLSSEWIDARTAAEWGLVLEVVPDDQLLDRAVAAAATIASRRLPSVVAVKRTMQRWRTEAIRQSVEVENAEFSALMQSRPGQP